MTPLDGLLPELPEAPKKHEYVNTQFDPEAPHTLSGVMNRWVAPEGYTGEEQLIAEMVVPRLDVVIVNDEQQSEALLEEEEEKPVESKEMAQVYKYPAFVFWFLGGGLLLMVVLNIILLLRK
jgi:hypothetical protein